MKKFSLIVLIGSVVLASGCASVVGGTSESVSVKTTPVSGAKCELTNNKGSWYIPQTPGSVVVHRSYKDLNVTCDKKGYATVTQKVRSRTKPLVLGNAIIGGVGGLVVDTVDGAAYNYPQQIQVDMKPGQSAAKKPAKKG